MRVSTGLAASTHLPSETATGRDMPFRGGGFATATNPWIAVGTLAALLLLWHAAAWLQADRIVLPAPAEVWAALFAMARSGELALHAGASLRRLLWGWSIGAGAGVAVGILIGLYPLVRSAAVPVVSLLFAMPKIALLPVFIVWLGIGETSKITTIGVAVFSPMVVATYTGIDAVDRSLIRMAQSFDLPTRSIVWKVLLPGALPSILAGVRVSAAIAIVLLVAAEMIGARYGIGALALNSGSLMRTDRLFAAVALLGGMGLAVSWSVGLAERRLLRWR
jgi:ABC-type nitrate/sulfonate/bicarbonate transport system permease component